MSISFDRVKEILAESHKKIIFVVGDCILDAYHYVEVTGVSKEGPALRVHEGIPGHTEWGGAATVARNLSEVVSGVQLITHDIQFLEEVSSRNHVMCVDLYTGEVAKHERFYNGANHQLLFQVDSGPQRGSSLGKEYRDKLDAYFRKIWSPDLLVFSDYGRGGVPKGFTGGTKICPIWATGPIADSCASECVCLNEREAIGFVSDPESCLIVTRGSKGVVIFDDTSEGLGKPIDAITRYALSTIGAGDCFMAWAAGARAGGASFMEAAQIGNVAAGLACRRPASCFTTQEELLSYYENETQKSELLI